MKRLTKAAAKLARENELLMELQRDHGYMLAKMRRASERQTTQVRGIRTGKMRMTLAQVVQLIVPDTSSLGRALIRDAKASKPRSRRP